jgi:lysophospholipase L1-like esterase
MRLDRTVIGLLGSQLILAAVLAQSDDDPVAALLQPLAPAAPSQSVPVPAPPAPVPLSDGPVTQVRLPDGRTGAVVRASSSRRMLGPRKPSFELRDGDRVLFLGDSLFDREAAYGYLETRLTSHYPDRNVTFWHLGLGTNDALVGGRAPADATKATEDGRKSLLARIGIIKPSVLLLAFGTDAARAGEPGLGRFKTNYNRLLDSITALDPSQDPRFVLFGPIAREKVPVVSAEPTKENESLLRYAQAVNEIATHRTCEFINCFDFALRDAQAARALAEKKRASVPYLTEDGLSLTPYGYVRLALALERGLRWAPNTWRVGIMANNSVREGGFGLRLIQHQRSATNAQLVVLEERLPSPNPPGYLDLEPNTKPQCYIQLPGFQPGRYALKTDGQLVLTGSDAEWARYEVISQGPQWRQAEQLRQAIVKKNECVARLWAAAGGQAGEGTVPNAFPFADPQLAACQASIARLRKPVKRTLEVIQVESGPPSPAPPSAGATPPGPSP